MTIEELAQELYKRKYELLNQKLHNDLIDDAKSEDEKYYYALLYNLSLQFKQNEIIKNEKY